MSLGTDPKRPNYQRPEYVATKPDLDLIAHEMGGTRTMHLNAATYIRKWGAEKEKNWRVRRVCEPFFEGLGRTVSACVGMLFAKPPEIEWGAAEEKLTEQWASIDGAGTGGHVFVKQFSDMAIRDGLALILVDHPSVPENLAPELLSEEGGVNGAAEQALNLRPIWARYTRAQAINWRVDVVRNRQELTLLVLNETAQVATGAYGVESRNRYRVLRLEVRDGKPVATWTLWEQGTSGPDEFVEIGKGEFRNRAGEPAESIPVAIAYTGRTDAPMQAQIPLLGVAWANLAHWQLSTSLRFNSEVAGLAQPTVIGDLAKNDKGESIPLEIGPLVMVHLASGGEFKWSEPTGTGLERLALLVAEKLKQMAVLGLSFMQRDTRAAETAEAKRLDASAENSTLATAAQGIEDAINDALSIHWWYLGGEEAGAPTIRLNPEYEDMTMSPELMTAYVAALREGLPEETFLRALQAGGRLPEGADTEALAMEMMAGRAAIEAQNEARQGLLLEARDNQTAA